MKRFMTARWCLFATVLVAAIFAFTVKPGGADAVTKSAAIGAAMRGEISASKKDDDDLLALSAVWWQWIYSIPVSKNPAFDTTGAFAGNSQPFNDVYFLAGSFISGPFTRNITVPRGASLFFPIINVEWDNVGVAPKDRMNSSQLRAIATGFVDAGEDLHAELNGTALSSMRLTSPVFSYHLPKKDNIYQFFGADVTGTIDPAVSDGYWVLVPSLKKGKHILTFGATVPGNGMDQPDFVVDLTYNITVK